MTTALALVLVAFAAIAAGVFGVLTGRSLAKKAEGVVPEEERQKLVESARAEADNLKRAAKLEAEERALQLTQKAQAELSEERSRVAEGEAQLKRREEALQKQKQGVTNQENELSKKERDIAGRELAVAATAKRAADLVAEGKARLEQLAKMTAEEAKAELVAQVVTEAKREAAGEVKKIEDAARSDAEEKAKRVLGLAIQRYAGEYVTERTVSVVPIPDDAMKGRIIGREGRNIRALEAATGIDLIIDDTPEAVIVSCFNPVRREIARLALGRLIADGRIHPTRIEEVVQKCTDEVEAQCKEAGEQAVFDLGLHKVHPELVKALGRLKFRSAAAQNLLSHSKEVGMIAGLMASELGLNVKIARRAGLLHDIGKGVDQEVEGSHSAVGAALAKKYNESPQIVAAIAEHHGEEPPSSVLSHVVDAANLLSGQRPGARQELLASYIQRLTDLEKLVESVPGVHKAYAISAGKELRVLVENSQVSDEESVLLAKELKKKIEDHAAYPGTVRISVIRETRSTDYAR